MTTAPADRRSQKPSAFQEFPPGGVVLKKLGPGTPRLVTRFGNALVCVRYRDDPAHERRLTTVELIVVQRPLPGPQAVRIGYEEAALRKQEKAAGGWWDSQRKLKLDHRVVAKKA